jgi:hypothetical protein
MFLLPYTTPNVTDGDILVKEQSVNPTLFKRVRSGTNTLITSPDSYFLSILGAEIKSTMPICSYALNLVESNSVTSQSNSNLKPTQKFNSIENKFKKLSKEWKEETDGYSTSFHKSINSKYLQIIALGKPVLPFIFNDLKKEPNHWFIALKAITSINPVPPEHMGNIKKMTFDWLDWAEQNKVI